MNLFKLNKSKKGFTLVELLIVIVILGILAALILPRLVAQPEKAKIGEAMNTMGAIRRAVQTTADSQNANVQTLCNAGTIRYNAIGVQDPGAAGRWLYSCANSGGTDLNIIATRQDVAGETSGYNGSQFRLSVNAPTWTLGNTGGGSNPYQIINSTPST